MAICKYCPYCKNVPLPISERDLDLETGKLYCALKALRERPYFLVDVIRTIRCIRSFSRRLGLTLEEAGTSEQELRETIIRYKTRRVL